MAETTGTVALLIIKAESGRVPGKNFRQLGNRPLFQWIIDTLMSVDEIDRIVINTDARHELIAAGLQLSDRLILHDRPKQLCGNHITANALLAYELEHVSARAYVMTHVTSPFLSANTIKRALRTYAAALEEQSADSLFGVTPHQARFYRPDATPINHSADSLIPTQALDVYLEENSSVYIFSRESFGRTGSRIGALPVMFRTPKLESLDIDDEEDWQLAEKLAATYDTGRSTDP